MLDLINCQISQSSQIDKSKDTIVIQALGL
jgi:hypothetical protein